MKRNILIYAHYLKGGGTEKSLISLLKNLNYSNYEVDLLLELRIGTPSNFEQIPKEVKCLSLYRPIFLNKNLNKPLFFLLKKLEGLFFRVLCKIYRSSSFLLYRVKLKNKKYDTEISYFHSMVGYLVNSPLKSKKILWVHMNLKYEMNFRPSKGLYKMLHLFQKMDKIISVSHQAKKALLSITNGLEEKIQVIYNGLKVDELLSKSQEGIIKKNSNVLQLLALGRLSHAKGFDRLLKVCYQLKQEGFDFHLWIIGDGENYDQLNFEVQQLNLNDKVGFLGYKENPYPYLKAADLFVLSSRHEAMPYVVLEALVLNKSIVSTDVTGPRELLEDGKYGLLIENSQEGIYKGLKKMITDKELRESFTKIKKDFSPFDPKNIAGQVEKVIEKLIINP